MKMYKMMWLMALALLFLVPKIGFADCNSDKDVFVPCEKTYFLPNQVAIAQEGFFVNLNDVWIQTDALFSDSTGMFIVSKKDANVDYCPQGHPTCKGCSLCHITNCWYYVKPCKLWN